MNLDHPLPLLGNQSPNDFMRRYWQKKPLLIRQAIPGFKPPVAIAAIKKLARRDDVESRLIWRENGEWQMENGPFARLPKDNEGDWTLLVQSVDLHSDAAAELMQQFRFIPDARLDDVMISIASHGGGVGPHFDSYDVFLLQAAGQREWRYGRQKDLSLEPGLPLKILSRFERGQRRAVARRHALPPQAAHDGIAVGDGCMTISIGFARPRRPRWRAGSGARRPAGRPYGEPALPGPKLSAVYRDPAQPAVATPAELPDGLIAATLETVDKLRFDEALASRFLGCWLTEPSNLSVFDAPEDMDVDLEEDWPASGSLLLDRRSRMLYRGKQLFINGETAMVPTDAALRKLADARRLDCADPLCARLSDEARSCLADWLDSGWIRYEAA